MERKVVFRWRARSFFGGEQLILDFRCRFPVHGFLRYEQFNSYCLFVFQVHVYPGSLSCLEC